MTGVALGPTPRPTAAYSAADPWTRLRVGYRTWMTPFGAIDSLVPRAGLVLDLGCGHGVFSVWLAQSSPSRNVHGVDMSEASLAHARSAVAAAGIDDRISIDQIAPGWEPEATTYDAVVVNDVLYLMDPQDASRLILACCRSLRPGGTLVVKEVADAPRAKYLLGLLQELVAVRVLRITQGTGFDPRPLDTARTTLADIGWPVHEERLDRGYPYSHAALVVTRPQ